MAVNKIVYGNQTLIDTSEDTALESDVVSGQTFHSRSGAQLTGSMSVLTFDDIYPVGSIYMSVNSTSPQTLFGGSWTPINGRFLVAQGSNDSSGDDALNLTAGNTGGKTDAIIPYHRHTLPALTTGDNSATHTHSPSGNASHFLERNSSEGTQTRIRLNSNSSGSYYTWATDSSHQNGLLSATATAAETTKHTHTVASGKTTNYSANAPDGATPRTSDNASNANLPPYLAVYMWKRTA